MSAPFPLLQFQAYNPMDTMIRAAMSTYGTIDESQQRAAQRQMMQKQQEYMGLQGEQLQQQMQYYPQQIQSQLAVADLQRQEALLRMQSEKMRLDMIRSALRGENTNSQGAGTYGSPSMAQGSYETSPNQPTTINRNMIDQGGANFYGMMSDGLNALFNPQAQSTQTQGQPMPQSGGAPSYSVLGSGSLANQYPGPSAQSSIARGIAGLPVNTPQEQADIKIWESQVGENTKYTQKIIEDAQKQSELANQAKGMLEGAHHAYQNVEKAGGWLGPKTKFLPNALLSDEYDVADNLSNSYAQVALPLFGAGGVGAQSMEQFKEGKLSPKLTPAAERAAYEKDYLNLSRMQERSEFTSALLSIRDQNGRQAFDGKDVQRLWNLYNSERPAWQPLKTKKDGKEVEIKGGNLNTWNAWLEQKLLDEAIARKRGAR